MFRPSRRRGQAPGLTLPLALILFIFISSSVVSCSDDVLPLEEWVNEWDSTVEHVQGMRTEPISQQQCEETVAFLRDRQDDLSPPPLADLRAPVGEWFSSAEAAFFDCDFGAPGSDKRMAFQTLLTFEAEVQTVLDLEG